MTWSLASEQGVQIAAEEGFETPSAQRALICRVLRVTPDRNKWFEYRNVAGEVEDRITTCKWYRVCDIAEAFYAEAAASQRGFGARNGSAADSESKLNDVLYEQGIAGRWSAGRSSIEATSLSSRLSRQSGNALKQSNRSSAPNEVAEALSDLSRRPTPDRTGAIQHSIAALECVARDISGDPKQTRGRS